MKSRPTLTTPRAVEIYEEMVSCRRMYYADTDFFRMDEFWDYLTDGESGWKINVFRSSKEAELKMKAAVVYFDGRATLTVDERLIARAKEGCRLSNYILAHELGHLALDHHSRSAVSKNFQLFSSPLGNANMPPTLEELEANYAAVFLQCGIALMDPRFTALDLARRAFSDVDYVKRAQGIVRLEVFQRRLNRPKPQLTRVVL